MKCRPNEINAHVAHRMAAVRQIESQLAEVRMSGTGASSIEEPPTLNDLENFVDDFISALGLFTESNGSAASISAFVKVQTRIIGMVRRCEGTPLLRPTLAFDRALGQVVVELSELWSIYVRVLSAPTLNGAQEDARKGQLALDSASGALAEYGNRAEAADALTDQTVPDFWERGLNALALVHPDMSLLELGEFSARAYQESTGVPGDEGQGASYLMLSVVAAVHFDPIRFDRVLGDAARLCDGNVRLAQVASQSGALDGLACSSRLMYESVTAFESVLGRVADDAALLRRIVKFYGEVYEDVAMPLFAWYCLLSGAKSQPYEKLMESDATTLAQAARRSSDVGDFFLGAQAHLRHAAQHGSSFSLRGQTVDFRLRSFKESAPLSEIIDNVYALLESLAATTLALTNSLGRAGIDVPHTQQDADAMGLTRFRTAELWMKQEGLGLLGSTESEDAWDFIIEDAERDPVLLALALSESTPAQVVSVTVRCSVGETNLVIPYSAYKEFASMAGQETPAADYLLGMLKYRARCSDGDASVLTSSDLRFAAARFGQQLLDSEKGAVVHLRGVLALARAAGEVEVLDLVSRIFAATRSATAHASSQMKRELAAALQETRPPAPPTATSVVVHPLS